MSSRFTAIDRFKFHLFLALPLLALAAFGVSSGAWSAEIPREPGAAALIAGQVQIAAKGDDLLLDEKGGDLLLDEKGKSAEEPAKKEKKKEENVGGDAQKAHEALFAEASYPSAATCRTCHPKQYKEWSVSQHSYSQLSPAYLSLSNKILQLSNGSNGDFCLRCHSPVGANLGEDPRISNLKRHPTSREGITCSVCHRINKRYNKVSGRLALEKGSLLDPVYGPLGNKEMERVLANRDKYRVVTKADEPGRKIHIESKQFSHISSSTFCGSCHDVTLFNGFRLEEAFSEYRTSPAAAKGVSCQDCHMGKEQGVVSGYDMGPAAIVGGVPTKPRRLANHLFSGPDYSLIHPGIFPHNTDAQEMATMEEWLLFDHKAGWGTEKFEKTVTDDTKFPDRWRSVDDRFDAREILNTQFDRLAWAREKRLEVLRNGYKMPEVIVEQADKDGIEFRVKVANGTDGHNVPTGFTGERLIWLKVEVKDRTGKVVFQSGHRDPNFDLLDNHSFYVHAGKMKLDKQLFSLQSRFVTQNGRGGETEHIIPIPYPVISLPRVLPSIQSLVFTGEPTTERNHRKGIEPLGHRWAEYEVDGDLLTGKGPYTAKIQLKSQPIPANIAIEIQDVGFDYHMTAAEVGTALIAGVETLWEKNLTFKIHN